MLRGSVSAALLAGVFAASAEAGPTLTLTLEKPSYELDELLTGTVTITNDTAQPVIISLILELLPHFPSVGPISLPYPNVTVLPGSTMVLIRDLALRIPANPAFVGNWTMRVRQTSASSEQNLQLASAAVLFRAILPQPVTITMAEIVLANQSAMSVSSKATEAPVVTGKVESKPYPYPLADILYHNGAYNSGWFYIARTVPQDNKTFWLAAVRSASVDVKDTSAHLLYGVTDLATGRYTQGILPGTLMEARDSVRVAFDYRGHPVLRFVEDKNSLTLNMSLPFVYSQTFSFPKRVLYEGGDGIIPITLGVDSLYASLAPLGDTYWADFQKFNVIRPWLSAAQPVTIRAGSGTPNHRWGSVVLNCAASSLPRGTAIVYWDIFDARGNRQPGGFTNIDVLLPNGTQKTTTDFSLKELVYWEGSGKTYLRKWRLTQRSMGVDLLIETITPDQEFKLPGSFSFYEGAVNVYDPATKAQIGSGMWEQTHDEKADVNGA